MRIILLVAVLIAGGFFQTPSSLAIIINQVRNLIAEGRLRPYLRSQASGLRICLRFGPYVLQDPQVDAMNDVVRPQMPIRCRPHRVAIPGGAFEARPSSG